MTKFILRRLNNPGCQLLATLVALNRKFPFIGSVVNRVKMIEIHTTP